ncbi:MAG TPA: HD domain-containing phosphohydrolase [Polyangiaceae bacterium]|jgi:response regulator RpfG family c-di-GMP phosphodiesterase
MASAPQPKVLCVDDEPLVLEGLTLHLRRSFKLFTAQSGAAGLELLGKESDFAVIMSDMRMPQMSGAQFLAKARELYPNSVRVLLTGQSDLESAISAVNEGQIFRFLTKPCPPNVLLSALGSAVKQHELIMAERVLLEQTLRGCVKTLTDILSLTNPTAFGRASRAKGYMTQLLSYLQRADDWESEVSAMLSQIGCVTLPGDMLDRMYEGKPLAEEEEAMAAGLPAMAERLLAHIPRLEGVREILLHMDDHYEPKPGQSMRGDLLPWGARALKIVLDFTALEWQQGGAAPALDIMRGRSGWYDATLLASFSALQGNAASGVEVRTIPVRELREGMVLHQNITTRTGMLVMAKGHEVTATMLERIANFSRRVGVREPISVVVNRASSGQRVAS